MVTIKCRQGAEECEWGYLLKAPVKESTKWVLGVIAGFLIMGGIWLGVELSVRDFLGFLGTFFSGMIAFIVLLALGVTS